MCEMREMRIDNRAHLYNNETLVLGTMCEMREMRINNRAHLWNDETVRTGLICVVMGIE